jgi:hypothetical protein
LDLGVDWIAWRNANTHGHTARVEGGEKSKMATLKSVAIKPKPDRLFSATYGEF